MSIHDGAPPAPQIPPFWAEGGQLELEIKLLATPSLLRTVRESWLIRDLAVGPQTGRMLINTYYDTPEHWFAARNLTVRVRSDGRRHVLGVKSRIEAHNGLFRRWEYERDIPSATLDLSVLAAVVPGGVAALPRDIAPVFETRFARIEIELGVPSPPPGPPARVAVAFDEGAIVAPTSRAPIAEIELELVSGPEEALTGLAGRLAATYPLQYGHASKAQRGYHLADQSAD